MPESAASLRAVRLTHPGFPPSFHHLQARLPFHHAVDGVVAAVDVVPPDWTDGTGETDGPAQALAAAVARHWCGEDVGQLDVLEAGPTGPTGPDVPAGPIVRLSDLDLLDPALAGMPGCPVRVPTPDDRIGWVPATRLRTGETGWAPYSQAVVRYLDGRPGHPVVAPMNMTGLGAGRTRAAALVAAVDDVLAQDLVSRWWVGGDDTPLPLLAPLPGADGVVLRRLGPAVLAVCDSLVVPDVVTLAAATTPRRAAALALWQHALALDLLDSDGALLTAGTPGLLPTRPRRDYLAAAGPRCRAAVDPLAALQLGLDPTLVAAVRRRTRPGPPASTPPPPPSRQVLLDDGDPWAIDLDARSTPAVGWRVCRVLAPGRWRIHPPAFARLDPSGMPYPGVA